MTLAWHRDELEKIIALPGETLAEVLPRMDEASLQVILVVDEYRHLMGIVTDGDIRRVLLRGDGLNRPLEEVMNSSPKVLPLDVSAAVARRLMVERNIRHIPLVDEQGRVVDVLLWIDLFTERRPIREEKVVITAGGKGTRLDPFTKILPKPMIPLGDKPMVEGLMDKFYKQGFEHFVLAVGYKGEIIRLYFQEDIGRKYRVEFIHENEPLGTAGALAMLRQQLDHTFVVTNCDIIVETDYGHLIEYHREKGNMLTVVGALRNFTIPYGVLRTEDQQLHTIDEKPSFHFLVNTGLYILEPGVLDLVEDNLYLDMTELIMKLKQCGLAVGVYPHHGKWFDVGQWEEYRQTLRHLELLG